MLLTQEHLKDIKQKSVSVDSSKTMVRFKEDFTAADSTDKNEIVELSGQKRTSIYRVYTHGTPNARLVLAMSQILNVSPYYYTGAEDERAPLTDELLSKFLNEHGYGDIAVELNKPVEKPKRKYNKKPKLETVEENVEETPQESSDDVACEESIESETENSITESQETVNTFDVSTDSSTEINDIVDQCSTTSDSENTEETVPELSEDEAIILLRALYIRAKSGSGEASKHMEIVKRCLLQ